jgi:hypothetical protein
MGKKVKYVHIDYWDTWNMDATLASIILPMLKQLKETKQGFPFVNNEDVPESLRSEFDPENMFEAPGEPFEEIWIARWDYVLDEMIWSFQFEADGKNLLFDVSDEEYVKYSKKLANGFRLFGKYYQNLWD